jgi:hypothetical protein
MTSANSGAMILKDENAIVNVEAMRSNENSDERLLTRRGKESSIFEIR